MPYQAQSQSLFGQVGAPAAPRPYIDVAGSIDALTSGATSLIHGAMARRNAENEMAIRKQQIDLEGQRIAGEQQRIANEQTNQNREFGLRQESERHRFIEAGGIPAHTENQTVGAPTPITAMNPAPSPVAQAMASGTGGAPSAIPPIQVTPSNAPASTGPGDRVNGNAAPAASPMSTTSYENQNVDVPEGYDPTKSAPYLRGMNMQQLRNEGYITRDEGRQENQREMLQTKLAAQQEGRSFAADAALKLAKWKQEHPTPKSSVARSMSEGQQEQMFERIAGGYIQAHGGSLDDALDSFRNTSQGRDLAKQGITENHLLAASRNARPDRATTQILGLVNSGAAKDVNDAASTVDAAQAASARLRGTAQKKNAPVVPATGQQPAPIGDLDFSKPGNPEGAAPVAVSAPVVSPSRARIGPVPSPAFVAPAGVVNAPTAPVAAAPTPVTSKAPVTGTPATVPTVVAPVQTPIPAPAAGAAPRRPLNDRERAAAKQDPKFQAFLKGHGYGPADWK